MNKTFCIPCQDFVHPLPGLLRPLVKVQGGEGSKSLDIVKNAEMVFSRPELSRKYVFEISRLLPPWRGLFAP
jgi:hypothetical protein